MVRLQWTKEQHCHPAVLIANILRMRSKTKIIITGTTGFIGSRFIQKYQDEYEFFEVSRERFRHLQAKDIVGFQADIFLNFASKAGFAYESSEIEEYIFSNITFPTTLAEWFARAGGKRIINIGSYWQHQENSIYRPNSFYAATKQAFEDLLDYYVEKYSLSVISLHLFDTYGPNDPRKKILRIIYEASVLGKKLDLSSGKQYLYLTHISDVIDGVNHALELKLEGHQKFFLRNPEAHTLREIAQTFLQVNNLEADLKWGIHPHSSRDFFTLLNVLPDLPGWKSKISMAEGLRNLFEVDTSINKT